MPTDDTVLEPARELSVLARADVVVAGGGTAGVAAAVAAAREGAQVVLLERGGVLAQMRDGLRDVLVSAVRLEARLHDADAMLQRALRRRYGLATTEGAGWLAPTAEQLQSRVFVADGAAWLRDGTERIVFVERNE